MAAGAKDYLTKPFDMTELLLRIGNHLETRFLQLDLRRQNATLEQRVQARTEELEAAYSDTLDMLARAGEYRDDITGQHTHRIGHITFLLAQQLDFPADQLSWIQQAARLHDIGKIGISDLILLKPGLLTEGEYESMKMHTLIDEGLLEGGHSDLIRYAQSIAYHHHEWWDGSGYPQGLSGEAIPIEARLLAVADVFDALTHDRPYKSPWTITEAIAEIERLSAYQFDPEVVEVFMRLPHETLI